MADSSRREFLGTLAGTAGVAWFTSQCPAIAQAAATAREVDSLSHLDADLAAAIDAIGDRILPSDEDAPGARAAGAIWFIDAAMGGFMGGAIGALRGAQADADRLAADRFATARFADLDTSQQDELMPTIADAPYFGTVHLLVVAGTLTMPSQGGNRDGVGWDLIGFDHRHGWQPPFGYYDRDANEDPSS